MNRTLAGAAAVTALFFALAAPAQAHRSGCHRWHSCPSDTGSYVCGDLGYTTFCPVATTPRPVAPAAAAPPAASTRVTTTNVNLRSGPGAQTARLVTLPQGARVTLRGCAGGWCQVTWQGRAGYVAQAYLR